MAYRRAGPGSQVVSTPRELNGSIRAPLHAPPPDYTSPAVRRARTPYLSKCGFILFCIAVDIFIATIDDHNDNPNHKKWYPLVLIGAHFVVLVLTTLVLCMMFFATYLFEVGLINVLFREFRTVVFVIPLYLAVLLAYAGVKLNLLLGENTKRLELWEEGSFVAVSVMQKLFSPLYYLIFVQAMIKLGQSRWYMREPWVEEYQANV